MTYDEQVIFLNKRAMEELKKENSLDSYQYLKRAE